MPPSDSPTGLPMELRGCPLYPWGPPGAMVDPVGSQALPLWTVPACCRPAPREPRRVHRPDFFPADSSLRPTTRGSATPGLALAAMPARYTLTGPHRSFTGVTACRFVSVPGRRTTPPAWWSLRARWSVRFDVSVTRTRRDPDYWGVSGLSPGGLLSSPKSRGFRLARSSAYLITCGCQWS
jgi:hypothetical protein